MKQDTKVLVAWIQKHCMPDEPNARAKMFNVLNTLAQ